MIHQQGTTGIAIIKAEQERMAAADDILAIEEPLEIILAYEASGTYSNKSISVTMRTPGHDKELGCGFLFTEGIIRSKEQIAGVQTGLEENKVHITLQQGVQPVLSGADRNFYTTSSCGVCGKASIEAIRTVSPFAKEKDGLTLAITTLYRLPEILRTQQEIFDSTGGLHAAALFDIEGKFLYLQEDVGRHNALDKVIGTAFLENNLPLSRVILLLSGRASFELIQKAAMAGIRIIAAVGAPSSLAVSLAKDNGMTLVGFLRGNRCNVYAGAERLKNI